MDSGVHEQGHSLMQVVVEEKGELCVACREARKSGIIAANI